jgi:hypothetical protein
MKKQTVIPQKKRGPPATGKGEPVVVRMHPPMLTELDDWIAKQNQPFPTRPEAIRRLVELGLKVKMSARPASTPGRRLRAQELATKAIEKIIDPAAAPEERAQRRRRLTKGPIEFREDRVDQPKRKG